MTRPREAQSRAARTAGRFGSLEPHRVYHYKYRARWTPDLRPEDAALSSGSSGSSLTDANVAVFGGFSGSGAPTIHPNEQAHEAGVDKTPARAGEHVGSADEDESDYWDENYDGVDTDFEGVPFSAAMLCKWPDTEHTEWTEEMWSEARSAEEAAMSPLPDDEDEDGEVGGGRDGVKWVFKRTGQAI
ncbi:hypothetical protein PSPO01_14931 [Paraphaeosphaeria sporulosa]